MESAMKAWALAVVAAAFVFTEAGAPVAHAAPPPAAHAAPPPAPASDNLQLVNSTQLRRVYVAPGADFRRFRKIILEPTEVAFADNWVRNFNSTQRGAARRLNDRDAERIKNDVSTGMANTFTRAFRDAGYQIVDTAGPDVLRVRTAVANLAITAPDLQAPGRSRTFAETAGEATLVLEARDSKTNALLGRALDRRVAGRTRTELRNSVTNRRDFQRVFQGWASASVEDLAALKAAHPGAHPAAH
jgi:hypothetical protein